MLAKYYIMITTTNKKSPFITVLNQEVVPALGCTEPIAVVLAVAAARETLNAMPVSVKVFVSANIYKNGMGVGIPGTGLTGLPIAAALGMVTGKSEDKLELLKHITPEIVTNAKHILTLDVIDIRVKQNSEKLYIEAVCSDIDGNTATAIIKHRHANICHLEKNGKLIFSQDSTCTDANGTKDQCFAMTVGSIYEFATTAPFDDIRFILESAKLNKCIAKEGLVGDFGLRVGKILHQHTNGGLLNSDLLTYAMSLTAAASDARMAGSTTPVMSNSGSGNQGITATLPVVAAAEKLGSSEEQLARALIISHLVAIHIKTNLGRLSALCGCVVAASGAGCGICYLMGGSEKHMDYTIKNMIGNVTGMICDGAKVGCALKVSSGVSSAVQSALLAMDGIVISANDGIIDEDVEKTIQNLCKVGSVGMVDTDKLLLDIMTSK